MESRNSIVLVLLGTLVCCLFSCLEEDRVADNTSDLSSIQDSVSYILGHGLANSYYKGNSEDMNLIATKSAIWDFINGNEFKISQNEGQELIARYLKMKSEEENDSLIKAGLNFLEKNAKRPEVKVLDRGLQYEVIKSGKESGASPDGNDIVKIKYAEGNISEGILWTQEMATNPTSKDTVSFALNREISGISQACQYMKEGDKWKVWIPHEIGSSEGKPTPAQAVKKYEVMYVEIELLVVVERDLRHMPNSREFKGYPGGYYLDKSKKIQYQGD